MGQFRLGLGGRAPWDEVMTGWMMDEKWRATGDGRRVTGDGWWTRKKSCIYIFCDKKTFYVSPRFIKLSNGRAYNSIPAVWFVSCIFVSWFKKGSTTYTYLTCVIKCSYIPFKFGFAPLFKRILTTSVWPRPDALVRGDSMCSPAKKRKNERQVTIYGLPGLSTGGHRLFFERNTRTKRFFQEEKGAEIFVLTFSFSKKPIMLSYWGIH